jgi:hypothetical protein
LRNRGAVSDRFHGRNRLLFGFLSDTCVKEFCPPCAERFFQRFEGVLACG